MKAPPSILLVEDEQALAETIGYNLEREGFRVLVASDGRNALFEFRQSAPALVVLDLMLPEMSGLDLCKLIRAESLVPIIILTAKDSEADKVLGLELGADDYVTKPFSMRELISRVRAQLRRAEMAPAPHRPGLLSAGEIEVDPETHEVRLRDDVVPMTPKEFALLELLIERKAKLLTRDFLIEEVWGPDYVGDTKTLDVHIRRLREKLEDDPHSPRHIVTVRGLGYKLVP